MKNLCGTVVCHSNTVLYSLMVLVVIITPHLFIISVISDALCVHPHVVIHSSVLWAMLVHLVVFVS